MAWPPTRILCLTEESVETLYLLGEESRIAGITPDAARPPRARGEKPRVAAWGEGDLPAALALRPDLALAAADLQAGFAAELARAGAPAHIFHPRDLRGALDMIRAIGALVGAQDRAAALVDGLEERMEAMRAAPPPRRPRVWAEQWDAPLMAAPPWVSELIEIAGGEDVALHLRRAAESHERIVTAAEIADARPELILASWRGKRVRPGRIANRPGWALCPAVLNGLVMDLPAPIFLSPGPGMLTEGLARIRAGVMAAAERDPAPALPGAEAEPPPLSRPGLAEAEPPRPGRPGLAEAAGPAPAAAKGRARNRRRSLWKRP